MTVMLLGEELSMEGLHLEAFWEWLGAMQCSRLFVAGGNFLYAQRAKPWMRRPVVRTVV